MTLLRLAALVTAALLALPAQAAPLLWTFDNAVFEDGGIATGSFVFDADTGSFSAVNVTTTAGTLASGAVYTDRVFGDATTAGLVTGSGDLTGTPLLGLAFLPPLTNAGGFVALIDIFFPPASSFEAVCDDAACMTATFSRQFVDGALVASPVPLPAAAWLFGAALGALPLLRRRG